ncbi:MAG: hypothetical protein LBS16_04445 [Prevotellaceae bacterium]|jgi:hypothetical protein|nr:hypothetical protein [Prevotellaceae bacterium]
MKKTLFVLLALITMIDLSAQLENSISGSASIAETSVADGRRWMPFHNPANLGYLDNTEVGLTFENRFFIKELSTKIAHAGIVTGKVNIGVGVSHFGYSVYHDILAGAALARNFSDRFAIGVQFNYFTSYFVQENRYRGALLGQIGANIKINTRLNVAFNAFNPFLTNIKTETSVKKLPSVYSLGTSFFFSESLVWRTQADKNLNANYRFATGFEYYFRDVFTLKLGVYGYDYLVSCLGAGLRFGNFFFDLNAEMHPQLGINTMGMLRYKL